MDLRALVPWWVKIILKIILSRLNISYKTWKRLNIFRHGAMDEPEYAYDTFVRHYESGNFKKKNNNYIMLELGPGDSVASGIIAYYFGAKKSYLVDKTSNAVESLDCYAPLVNYLNNKIGNIDTTIDDMGIEEIMERWNIAYLTDGLDSLKSISDASIDYLWSQSVLEHIRKSEFKEYIKQFRRIISDDGVCVHGIDLKDHLSYAHNNLRFSEAIWESNFMANSGFYTNRIMYSDMIQIFKKNRFDVEILNIKHWDKIATSRNKLNSQFCNLSEEDLLISEFDVILRPV